jgi:hypothetical protein
MKAKELGSRVYEVLTRINYARKVNSFSESTASMFIHLADETKAVIKSFPVLDFDDDIDLMDIDTLDGDQQFYVFHNTTTDGYFLVDTQGYNYPRYITRLWGFMNEETEDEGTELNTFEYMEGMIRIANDQKFTAAVRYLVADFLEEGEFHKSDMLAFLQYKLNKAFEEVAEKL